MEIWKDIIWYEWKYQISSYGEIKNNKYYGKNNSKTTKLSNRNWYNCVTLYLNFKKKSYNVHRLLANTFIPNHENKPQVNHIDWNKRNNSIDNLEWCTNSENMIHSFRILGNKNLFQVNHPDKWKFWKDSHVSKPVNQYSLDWKLIKTFSSGKEACEALWILRWNLSSCLNWKRRKTWWYTWSF